MSTVGPLISKVLVWLRRYMTGSICIIRIHDGSFQIGKRTANLGQKIDKRAAVRRALGTLPAYAKGSGTVLNKGGPALQGNAVDSVCKVLPRSK